ncbi:DUF1192 family protein [Acuticoccus mangrovi]|uniref:DUF1192 domain-containing protein n=1 Tax=Acuticoccus mangrovi TaxID=2796142 RepID=A0A934IKJ4_9HYPH|nr:DUF1192 family protein [Acuticoccus mangrovi]MBJ3774320.1 DUF1192 domain-containing protein [Acuticoccus mangrovi]
MDDEPLAGKAPGTQSHTLGDDLSRLSVRELAELKAACLAEAERIDTEMRTKDETREAANSVFRF